MSTEDDSLACTGERVIEDDYKKTPSRYLIYLFHIATYNFCLPYLQGKKVLEFGSGSGYGTHRLSGECQHITGVDISADAIAYAKNHYVSDNLEYRAIQDIQSGPLPFADNEFDVVISFQVMEHIRQVDEYLAEIQRVLRDQGTLIIATPDRTTRLFSGQRPWNRYHVTEYDPESFLAAMVARFPDTKLNGMSARRNVIDIELNRTRRTRLVTYPFTFPLCPEWYRQLFLGLLKKISTSLLGPVENSADDSRNHLDYGFSIDDIEISQDASPSVNIISVSSNGR